MQWPVAPTTAELTQPAIPYPAGSGGEYGWRADVGRMHWGYDFRAPAGRPAYAIAPGRVYFVASGADDGTAAYPAGWAAGGRQVWIQHDGFMSRYLHLSEPQYQALRAGGAPIYFGGPGTEVQQGQLVGTVGGTNFAGAPYGAHLHLEIVVNGAQVDPIPFITDRLGETDMPLDANADYEAFKTMLQRAFRFDLRPDGAGADWRLGPTVWERFNHIQADARQLDLAVVLYLHVPSNKLLLVDHLNRRIRDLGASAGDPVRAHFASKPFTHAYDAGTSLADKPAGSVTWQTVVDGYSYV
ncbi:M23 family metallopeptidase [Microbacterium caowuchunii]|uniref:M23 family metallopeptidase n=1 Tax=Microbacterium caowuchunii TaxID=2614638 RepID=A0A5N0TGZ6_9MICO|nr:M23 family metallopeptidase [Microbacterium caowuchunii]KAA9133744.1 M23 family metallopeptidase [Microbacterium caowuchunii]